MNGRQGSRGFRRRELVGGAIVAGATLALGARVAQAEDDTEPAGGHWSHVGDDGPYYRGNPDPAFAACSLDNQQSPINFPVRGNPDTPDLELPEGPYATGNILNNSHTIQLSIAPGVTMHSCGAELALKQIHMHARASTA